MWDLIVSHPDHCLYFYIARHSSIKWFIMADFENPMFDPDGPGIDDDYSFDLANPPLDVQQQLDASGERIQSMRGEIRQGELEDQKKRLAVTFYNEVNRAYGFRLEGRFDYEQFGIDGGGKTLYWTPGDKRIPMTATRGKFDFLALSSPATKYRVGGTVAVQRSPGLTGYTLKTSRLSSAAEKALRQADKALCGSASNSELQDLSGVVNIALRSTEQAETALDGEESKALKSINDQLLDTAWVSPAARELAGLKKAMTELRDELVNNLAKLYEVDKRKSEVEKHLTREHQKLTETSDPEIQQEKRDRIKKLEQELSDIKIERESKPSQQTESSPVPD